MVLMLDLTAKIPHDAHCEIYIGLRNEAIGHLHLHPFPGVRAGEKDGGEKLAALTPSQCCLTALELSIFDDNRGTAVAVHRSSDDPKGFESLEEVLNGTLPHPLVSIDHYLHATKTDSRCQKTDCRPGSP